jgi:hypothetical protein
MLVKLVLKHRAPYNPFIPCNRADLVIFDEDRSREGEEQFYYSFRCLTSDYTSFFDPEPIDLLHVMQETLEKGFGECRYVGVFTDGHCWEVEILDELLLTDPNETVRWFASTREAPFYIKLRGPPNHFLKDPDEG